MYANCFIADSLQYIHDFCLVLALKKRIALWKAILISWFIALFEYCLTAPANHIGFTSRWNGCQLKIVQEIITLVIFNFPAVWYLKEPIHWKYLISFAVILAAVYFAFKKIRVFQTTGIPYLNYTTKKPTTTTTTMNLYQKNFMDVHRTLIDYSSLMVVESSGVL